MKEKYTTVNFNFLSSSQLQSPIVIVDLSFSSKMYTIARNTHSDEKASAHLPYLPYKMAFFDMLENYPKKENLHFYGEILLEILNIVSKKGFGQIFLLVHDIPRFKVELAKKWAFY